MNDASSNPVDRLVDAAERVLALTGDISMRTVAAEAKLSLTTLYNYFPSKDLLVLGVGVARMREALEHLKSRPPLPGSTPGERLATFLLRYFRSAQREPAVARALALLDPTADSEDGRDAARHTLSQMSELVHQMAVTAATGEGPPLEAHADSMVDYALSMLHLGCLAWLSGALPPGQVRRSIAFGGLLVDLPALYANTLLEHADRLATPRSIKA